MTGAVAPYLTGTHLPTGQKVQATVQSALMSLSGQRPPPAGFLRVSAAALAGVSRCRVLGLAAPGSGTKASPRTPPARRGWRLLCGPKSGLPVQLARRGRLCRGHFALQRRLQTRLCRLQLCQQHRHARRPGGTANFYLARRVKLQG